MGNEKLEFSYTSWQGPGGTIKIPNFGWDTSNTWISVTNESLYAVTQKAPPGTNYPGQKMKEVDLEA